MGFFSAGRDQGSTFYFELPLYTAAFVGFNPEQATRAMLLSQSRLTIPSPITARESADPIEGLGNEANAVRQVGNLFLAEDVAQESSSNESVEALNYHRKGPRKSNLTDPG